MFLGLWLFAQLFLYNHFIYFSSPQHQADFLRALNFLVAFCPIVYATHFFHIIEKLIGVSKMFVINVESSLSLLLLINASIHNFFVEVCTL